MGNNAKYKDLTLALIYALQHCHGNAAISHTLITAFALTSLAIAIVGSIALMWNTHITIHIEQKSTTPALYIIFESRSVPKSM